MDATDQPSLNPTLVSSVSLVIPFARVGRCPVGVVGKRGIHLFPPQILILSYSMLELKVKVKGLKGG